jgi:EAL domain-containing protein (putative c-di-GMP-specific phosphodiesterase class I)
MQSGNQAVSDPHTPEASSETASNQSQLDHLAVEHLLAELVAGELTLVEQGIHLSDDPQILLYHECLLRRHAGQLRGPSLFPSIAAAERLGRIRQLDHFVAFTVVERLIGRPSARLGVNISAQSAALDDQWLEILALMDAHPGVASRLVIEVTETAALADQYVAFFEVMRSRSITIAVDDYGVGHSTRERVEQIRPDIVKIDGHYTRNARKSEEDVRELQRVAIDLSALCPTIVLEGVETEADKNTVLLAGIAWAQGYGFD